jgi:hypothetical protein
MVRFRVTLTLKMLYPSTLYLYYTATISSRMPSNYIHTYIYMYMLSTYVLRQTRPPEQQPWCAPYILKFGGEISDADGVWLIPNHDSGVVSWSGFA